MAIEAEGRFRLSALLDARNFQNAMGKTERDIQKFASTATVAGFRLNAVWAATFGLVGAAALKFGSQFETAFAGVKKTVDPATTDLKKLENQILDLSKSMPYAADQLADFARIGGQLGISGEEDLGSFVETIAKLGIAASELPVEQAAKGLARFASITGEGNAKIADFASILAFLGDKLPTTEERILNFSVRLAGMASSAGLSGEEILGLSAAFSSVVEGTERASSSVERFLADLIGAVSNGGTELESFAELAAMGLGDASMSAEQFAEMFRTNAGDAVAALLEGMGKLGEQGADQLLKKFDELGITNIRMVQSFITVANAGDKVREAFAAATESEERFKKLNKEFAVQMDTVNAQLTTVWNTLKVAGIELFKAFEPEIRAVIDVAKDFALQLVEWAKKAKELPTAIKVLTIALLGLIPVVATLMIFFGQLGTSIVTGMTLWKASGDLIKTVGLRAAATSGQLGGLVQGFSNLNFMGAETAGKVGALSKVLTPLSGIASTVGGSIARLATAVGGSFTAAVVVGTVAGTKLGKSLLDTEDPINRNIESAGTLRVAWEAVSIVADGVASGFKNALDLMVRLAKSAASSILETFKGVGEGITSSIIGAIESTKLGQLSMAGFKAFGDTLKSGFNSAVNATSSVLTDLMTSELALEDQTAKARNEVAIMANAMQIAGGPVLSLAQAQKILAENTKLAREEQEKVAVLNSQGGATAKQLKSAEDYLKQADAANRLQKAASFLGITEEKLVQEGLLPAAEALMKQKKASEESAKEAERLKKAHDELVNSFTEMTKQAQAEEFNKLLAAFQESKVVIGDLAEDELDAFIQKLEELATAAGIDATNALKDFKAAADLIDVNKPIKMREDSFNLRGFTPTVKPPKLKPLKDVFENELKKVEEIGKLSQDASDAMDNGFSEANKTLRETAKAVEAIDTIMGVFGINSDNVFAGFVKGAISLRGSIGSAITAIQGLSKSGDLFQQAGQGGGGFLGGLTGGKGFGSFSGIISAIGNIGQLAGPIGSAVSSVVGLISGLFKKEWEKVSDEVARDFGVEISEDLAKEIEKVAKDLDLGRFEATLLKLGDIIGEAGGLTESNADKFLKGFNDLLNATAMGVVPLQEGMKAIGESFTQIADGLKEMGVEGKVQIGELISRMRELGLVTEEVKEFIRETAQSAVDNFTVFLDFLDKRFTESFMDSAEAVEVAEQNVSVLTATFAAAVNAAGGFAGALELLPESFEGLLTKFRELLGDESAALNKVTEFYNFLKNNSEQLGAIEALINGMTDLATIGILSNDMMAELGASAIAQMQDLLANTQNQTLALVAMGPQIGALIEQYRAMGMEVPPELQEIADAAIEAGASLEPPEGLEDILADIRDILYEVAEAFGVAANEARDFNNAAGGAGTNAGGPPGNSGNGNAPGMATGGFVPRSPGGMLIRAGEGKEGEFIIPESAMAELTAGGGGGGGSTVFNMNFNGTNIGTSQEFQEAVAMAFSKAIKKSSNTGDLRSNLSENF